MLKNNWDIVAQNFPPEKIPELKEIFAKAMAKYNEDTDQVLNDVEFTYAMENNIACKLYAINNWTYDINVKKRIEHYKNDGVSEIMATKMQVAQMLWQTAKTTLNVRDRILALQEYSRIMGYDKEDQIQQQGATQNVILVTDNGSNMTWEEKLRQNQHDLQKRADEVLGLDDEVIKH